MNTIEHLRHLHSQSTHWSAWEYAEIPKHKYGACEIGTVGCMPVTGCTELLSPDDAAYICALINAAPSLLHGMDALKKINEKLNVDQRDINDAHSIAREALSKFDEVNP